MFAHTDCLVSTSGYETYKMTYKMEEKKTRAFTSHLYSVLVLTPVSLTPLHL